MQFSKKCLLAAFALVPCFATAPAAFDLTQLAPGKIMPLSGQWEFFSGQLLTTLGPADRGLTVHIPSDWRYYPAGENIRFGTFALRLKTLSGQKYLLSVPRIFTTVRIIFHEQTLFEAGKVSSRPEQHVPAITNARVHFSANAADTVLLFQVSNFSLPYGGIFYTPSITPAEGSDLPLAMLFEFAIVILFLAGGIYHILLQHTWRRDRSHILLGAALLSIALRTAFSGHDFANILLPQLPWQLHYRIEFASLYLMVVAMLAFAYEILGAPETSWLKPFSLAIGLALVIPVLVAPVSVFTAWLSAFHVYTVIVLIIAIYLVLRAIRRRTRFWQLYTISMLVFTAAAINDILAAQFGVKTGYVTKEAFLLFVLLQAGLLNAVFLEAFKKAEAANQTLTREIALSEHELLYSYRQNESLLKTLMADVHEARCLQESLLPRVFPQSESLRIYGRYLPMDLVGGDMYAFANHPGGRIGILIADVTGHGIAAATVAASTRLLYSIYAQSSDSPAEILRLLNTHLPDHIGRHFLTAICAVYDPTLRTLTFANAGHPPLILLSQGSTSRQNARGTLLGAFEERHFEEQTLRLQSGDRVLMFTDGLTEAKDAAGHELGDDGLTALVMQFAANPLEDWVDAIVGEATRHRGSAGLSDDITVVALEVA